jgi:hypothetical protein
MIIMNDETKEKERAKRTEGRRRRASFEEV